MTLIDTRARSDFRAHPKLVGSSFLQDRLEDHAPSAPVPQSLVLAPPEPVIPGLAGRVRFDPLAPLVAILPLIALTGTSLSWHPAALILVLVAPMLLVAQARRGSLSLLFLLLFIVLLTLGCASAPPSLGLHDDASLFTAWPWFSPEHWNSAFNVSARIGAILALILLAGLLSDPSDTIRAFVVHLRMPTRIGQAGIAALGFAKLLRREHRAIREAHLLRGSSFDLPILETGLRWLRSAPALIAGAIRHAERVSMSMDARAFGAYPRRTERSDFSWRRRDTLLLICAFTATVVLVRFMWDSGFVLTPTRS